MNEWTIEGDETMRWDVLASASAIQRQHDAEHAPDDSCDRCGETAELFHNEATGMSLCESCDIITDDVEAALEDRHSCDGCNGSGIYYGAGRVENGVFIGFKGTCYRCHGKGWQDDSDVRRNTYYDNRIRRIQP